MSIHRGKRFVWAVLIRRKNRLDGKHEHIENDQNCVPRLFRTKREAAQWIEIKHGYLRNRLDLRREPHGWKMPIPISVTVRGDKQESTPARDHPK